MDAGIAEKESVRAARVLREQILTGARRPGSRLVERAIAAELGVSRLPVREALRTLESEGIVATAPRRGAAVRELRGEEIANLNEVHQAFDRLMVRLAAIRRTEEEAAQLVLVAREVLDAAERGDQARALDAATRVRFAVAAAAHNEVLGELIAALQSRMRLLFALPVDMRRQGEVAVEICDAIARADPDGAEEALRRYLSEARVERHGQTLAELESEAGRAASSP